MARRKADSRDSRNGALRLRSQRVVLPDGVRPATVEVGNGRIVAVETGSAGPAAAQGGHGEIVDLGATALLPGGVDPHVHVNEPGRTDWEGFAHAGRGAAAGGITTIVDMPLNSLPPTIDTDALERKRRAAAAAAAPVDVGFWGGVVPGNAAELAPLAAAGALGFKAFLCPSGVDEFPATPWDELERALEILTALDRPLLVHAEDPALLDAPGRRFAALPTAERRRYAAYLASRPTGAEVSAIVRLVEIVRALARRGKRARVHVVHVAAEEALPVLARARGEGLAISGETCPHYLTFVAEEVADGATEAKCAPPLREARHREALWQALGDGVLSFTASDHSPSPPAGKALASGDFHAAWGGIASLQVALPAVWSGARQRGFGLDRLAEWTSRGPAELAGLAARKGRIQVGYDADLVAFDPDASFVVDRADWLHRHPVSPYFGRRLTGVVRRTFVGGREVYRQGEPRAAVAGSLLER